MASRRDGTSASRSRRWKSVMRLAARASARRPSAGSDAYAARIASGPSDDPRRGPGIPAVEPAGVLEERGVAARADVRHDPLRGLADGGLVLVRAAGADLRPGGAEGRVAGVELLHAGTSVEARIYSPDAPSWRAMTEPIRGPPATFRAMNPRTDLWLQNLVDERDGAALYEGLARHEKDAAKARSLREIAEAERRHAEVWRKKLEKEGVAIPPDRPSSRIRALIWLARRLGTAAVFPMVLEAEAGDAEKYDAQGGDAIAIADEEREHRRTIVGMSRGEPTDARELIAVRERWHRSSGAAGSIRAAIFGMNDGLVSNLSLIVGVAGAGVEPRTVVVTGFAGLLAGAFSMAAGEYTSVASQRDLLTRQVEMERREIEEAPEEEAAELALIFKQKGLSTEQASRTAAELLKNPESAADTLVREELGLDPTDLGSPIGAALSSFAMFSVGAARADRPVPAHDRHGRRRDELGASPSSSSPASAGSSGSSPGTSVWLLRRPDGGARRARGRRHLRRRPAVRRERLTRSLAEIALVRARERRALLGVGRRGEPPDHLAPRPPALPARRVVARHRRQAEPVHRDGVGHDGVQPVDVDEPLRAGRPARRRAPPRRGRARARRRPRSSSRRGRRGRGRRRAARARRAGS